MVLEKIEPIHAKRKKKRKERKRKETRPPSYLIYKNKLKWNKDFNVIPEIIKLLEENRGSKPSDIALSNIFFLTYLLRQRKQNKQMGLHQTKRFCTAKETMNNMKTRP